MDSRADSVRATSAEVDVAASPVSGSSSDKQLNVATLSGSKPSDPNQRGRGRDGDEEHDDDGEEDETLVAVIDEPSLIECVRHASEVLESSGKEKEKESGWRARVRALQQIRDAASWIAANSIRKDSSSSPSNVTSPSSTAGTWLSLMSSKQALHDAIISQLSDRRSQIIKQACATITTISATYKHILAVPSGESKDEEKEDGIASATASSSSSAAPLSEWVRVSVQWVEALLPLIPVSTRIIHAAACLCLSAVVKNVAHVYVKTADGDTEYPLIHLLASHCRTDKHGSVRDHCYRALSHCMARMDKRYVEKETKIESGTNGGADLSHSSSESDSSATGHPAVGSSSALFSLLSSTIRMGVSDSFERARTAARLCLIHLRRVAPSHAASIIDSLSPSQRSLFDQQLSTYQANLALGTDAAGGSSSGSGSSSGCSSPSSCALVSRMSDSKISSNGIADDVPVNTSDEELAEEVNPSQRPLSSSSASGRSSLSPSSSSAATNSSSNKRRSGGSSNKESPLAAMKKAAAARRKQQQQQSREGGGSFDVEVLAPPLPEPEKTHNTNSNSKPTSKGSDENEKSDDASSSSSTSAPSSAATTASISEHGRRWEVFRQLLDLETPMLTEKLIEFLLQPDALDAFLSFITQMHDDDGRNMMGRLDVDQLMVEVKDVDVPPPLAPRPRPDELPDEFERSRAEADTRRSFHVMQFLTAQKLTQSLMAILQPKLQYMTVRLLMVAHPRSRGNFYHATAVLLKLLQTFPGTTLTAICSPHGRILLSLLFDHLHEPPVIPFLLSLLEASLTNRVVGSREPTDVILHLTRMDILNNKLVARLIQHPAQSPSISQACAEFITQYIDKMQSSATVKSAESMMRLLEGIGEEGGMVDRLAHALTDRTVGRPSWQQSSIASLLQLLVKSSAKPTITIVNSDPTAQALAQMLGNMESLRSESPNPIHRFAKPILKMLTSNIEAIGNAVVEASQANGAINGDASVDSSSSSPAVSHPSSFTPHRLHMLRILVECVETDCLTCELEATSIKADRSPAKKGSINGALADLYARPRLFDSIPKHVWETLVDYFFLYQNNNFYLASFKALIIAILKHAVKAWQYREKHKRELKAAEEQIPSFPPPASDATLMYLFFTTRFVVRMIALYTSPSMRPSCATAFTLDLLNHLRLSCSQLPSSAPLSSTLASTHQYHLFLPTLRSESLKQCANLHIQPVKTAASGLDANMDPERTALERALGLMAGGGGGGGGGEEAPANPNAFIVPEGFGEGIDIGSVFAYHLGYRDKDGVEAATKKKKQKHKKKKKKKNKDANDEGTDADAEDEEHEHEGDHETPNTNGDRPQPWASVALASPTKPDQEQGHSEHEGENADEEEDGSSSSSNSNKSKNKKKKKKRASKGANKEAEVDSGR